jgi:hypothetical protein
MVFHEGDYLTFYDVERKFMILDEFRGLSEEI